MALLPFREKVRDKLDVCRNGNVHTSARTKVFFDQWLLPKLNVINRVTTIYTDSVKAWFGSDMLDHFEVVFKTRKSWPEACFHSRFRQLDNNVKGTWFYRTRVNGNTTNLSATIYSSITTTLIARSRTRKKIRLIPRFMVQRTVQQATE